MISSLNRFLAKNLKHFEGSFNQFKELLNKTEGLVVVDFYADWCGPCQILGKILPEIAEDHPKVTFVKANVDETLEVTEHYNIETIPQIKFFKKDGKKDATKEISTIIGANPEGIDTLCTKFE